MTSLRITLRRECRMQRKNNLGLKAKKKLELADKIVVNCPAT